MALRIAILNLMPLKEDTENDFLRLLKGVEVVWMRLRTHQPRHTSQQHMDALYTYFDELADKRFDGVIITGAPVELLPFEEVTYWQELCRIFDWSRTNARSAIYICWGAQAALYHFYAIQKYPLPSKKFGIFTQDIYTPDNILFKGFADTSPMPHSRHTEIRTDEVKACKELTPVMGAETTGVSMIFRLFPDDHRRLPNEIFITGHMEYNTYTLDTEYRRDKGKRDDVGMPENYYIDNNPDNPPADTWHESALRFYENWIAGLESERRAER